MIAIGISQHESNLTSRCEMRDALDMRWSQLLKECGLAGVPLPNDYETALWLANHLNLHGIILTGGDNPLKLGGTSNRRESCELALIEWARKRSRPVLGICRGMQLLLLTFGSEVVHVEGHAGTHHQVIFNNGIVRIVNSYHTLAAFQVQPPLNVMAYAGEVVEAIYHTNEPLYGWMWHPERNSAFDSDDINAIRKIFNPLP